MLSENFKKRVRGEVSSAFKVTGANGIPTFLRLFGLILIAEAITISVAWLLLDFNASRWIQKKAEAALHFSQVTAASGDWSQIDKIRSDQVSATFENYKSRLEKLSDHYFPRKEGMVYITVVKNGRELEIAPNDDNPLDDFGKADQWESAAYAQGKPTYSTIPIISENAGTYLAAYVPITKDGHVIGLIATEYDEAPMTDFLAIIRSTFLFSIVPAVLISLLVAYLLTSMFVQPMDFLREIEETAKRQRSRSPEEEKNDPWNRLTSTHKRIAELLRQGVESYKDLADALSVEPDTIHSHLQEIRQRTGWSRLRLAVEASARRNASAASSI